MQDRPDRTELLRGIERLLNDELVPALQGSAQFRARVAANVAGIVLRELEAEPRDLAAEQEDLIKLLGEDPSGPPTAAGVLDLNAQLSRRIRNGDADAGEFRTRAIECLRRATLRNLAVANPKMFATVSRDWESK